MEYGCVKLDRRLVAKIDEYLENIKKPSGLPAWRSRAGFVQAAVEAFIETLQKERIVGEVQA